MPWPSDFIPTKTKLKVQEKNSIGAKEAFKHFSHAYSVLIDAEKRNHYDQFGPEDDRPRPRDRAPNPQEDYEYDEYDDIFRVFFGGVPVHHVRRGNFQSYFQSESGLIFHLGGLSKDRSSNKQIEEVLISLISS